MCISSRVQALGTETVGMTPTVAPRRLRGMREQRASDETLVVYVMGDDEIFVVAVCRWGARAQVGCRKLGRLVHPGRTRRPHERQRGRGQDVTQTPALF